VIDPAELAELRAFAIDAARAAGRITLQTFGSAQRFETKPDGSPVTGRILCTDFSRLEEPGDALERLAAHAGWLRTWGDCYGHALVATGRAEAMIDPH
jgi:fructose-1,6-bisphosphatase/inositol monophosphatase family enzyme